MDGLQFNVRVSPYRVEGEVASGIEKGGHFEYLKRTFNRLEVVWVVVSEMFGFWYEIKLDRGTFECW